MQQKIQDEKIVEYYRKICKTELDGTVSHQLYSPPYRPLLSTDQIMALDPKLAAVNILLYPKENQWYFPLMVRSVNQHDRHSGQISLPVENMKNPMVILKLQLNEKLLRSLVLLWKA